MCALQLTKSTAGVSFRYTSPVGGRQSHVVGKANYGSSLYSELQGGCGQAHRYHFQLFTTLRIKTKKAPEKQVLFKLKLIN